MIVEQYNAKKNKWNSDKNKFELLFLLNAQEFLVITPTKHKLPSHFDLFVIFPLWPSFCNKNVL